MTSGLPWGLALSSGVNTYLPLFMLALFARHTDLVRVSPRFDFLVSNEAILVLGVLALLEILADKFPVIDNVWDFIHTPLRPLAGGLAATATAGSDQAIETGLAVLVGGTLAAATHSAKSCLRLASTTKGFGLANPLLSLGEDAAVVGATLLSVYAPWVMFGVVGVLAVVFVVIFPRLWRMVVFNLQMGISLFRWLGRRGSGAPKPQGLQESLLEVSPEQLRDLSAQLEPEEELHGTLPGWKRAPGGPRRSWLVVSSRRVLAVEPRRFRKPKVEAFAYPDLQLVRCRPGGIQPKLDLLTRRNQSVTFYFRKTHALFGEMVAEKVRRLSTPASAESRSRAAPSPSTLPALP